MIHFEDRKRYNHNIMSASGSAHKQLVLAEVCLEHFLTVFNLTAVHEVSSNLQLHIQWLNELVQWKLLLWSI